MFKVFAVVFAGKQICKINTSSLSYVLNYLSTSIAKLAALVSSILPLTYTLVIALNDAHNSQFTV